MVFGPRAFLPCLLFLAAASAEDKLEIDNQWVRVLRVKQAPHEKSAPHEHPATVIVYLTDARQRITPGSGPAQEVFHKAQDVAYFEAAKHTEENIGDAPLEMAVIELKPGPKGGEFPVALDPVRLDPEHHPVPFENDRVRILRTILVPKVKSPMHEHPHYVVVYLTELHTTMKMPDGREVDNPRRPGEIAWRDFMKHETLNIGEKTAVEIQVELK
jgi:hypothetical protein